MHEHEDWKLYLVVGLLVVLNILASYLILRKGATVKKTAT
jgi:hypothetical protein